MKAKEMFEKIGYQEIENFGLFGKSYRRLWTSWYENDNDLIEDVKENGKLRMLHIDIGEFIDKYIHLTLKDVDAKIENNKIVSRTDGELVGFPPLGFTLSLEELEAINKQVEELGLKE